MDPGSAIAVELIDLYIATSLVNLDVILPPQLDINAITPEYYRQLAPIIYLPPDYTLENISRAKRILRIISDIIGKNTPITTIQPTIQPTTIQPIAIGNIKDIHQKIP